MHERQQYEHLGDVVIGVIFKNQEKTFVFSIYRQRRFKTELYGESVASKEQMLGNRNRDLPLVRSYQDDLL